MANETYDLEDRLSAFTVAWQPDVPPDLQRFLPAEGSPQQIDALIGLASIDLERRLQAGQSARVESLYLARFPALRAHPAAALELIRREWDLRRRVGPQPSLTEFLGRFPEHRDELSRLLGPDVDPRLTPELTVIELPRLSPLPSHAPAEGPAVLELLGRGGMGEVYRGRDGTLGRDLAVKVLPSRLLHERPELVQRFIAEAQIAGQLQHPGVVPVYQLGWLPDGRPFFTMKLVKGRTFAELLAERPDPQADLDHFLGIFEDVCQAMAYAHSRGVLHRDLKPENVMVGAFGEVQVVDWGLAKVLARDSGPGEQPGEDGTVIRTVRSAGRPEDQTGQVGTPAYSAPEQARGEIDLVDERADVFGLGAILCVVLTGQPPFVADDRRGVLRLGFAGDLTGAFARLDGCGADEDLVRLCKECLAPQIEQRPRHGGVVAARVAAYRAAVQTRLHQAERERAAAEVREREAQALAAAERRVAEAERKRRRMTVVLAGALLLVLAVAGAVAWQVQQRWAEARARGIAEQNLELAREAVDKCFVVATEDPLLQQESMRKVRKLLLSQSLAFYQSILHQRPDDAAISFELANNYFRVARITGEVGSKEEALGSYVRAYEAVRALVSQQPDNDVYTASLARIADSRGVLLRDTGQWGQAQESLEEALALRQKLVDRYPASAGFQSDLAGTCNNLGLLQHDRKQVEEALDSFAKAHTILERLRKKYPAEARYESELATTLQNRGRLLLDEGKVAEALQSYKTARDLFARLAGAKPAVTEYRHRLADTLTRIGGLVLLEAPDEARKSFEQAQKLSEALVREEPEVVEYQAGLANACTALGVSLHMAKDAAEAQRLHRRALKILEQLTQQDEGVSSHRISLAGTCVNLGNAARITPAPADSLRWYGRAMEEIQKLKERGSPEARAVLYRAHYGRALALVKLGRHRESLPDYLQALEVSQADDRPVVRLDLAFALAHAGQYTQAMAEVGGLLKGTGVDGRALYNLACVTALSAKALAEDGSRPKAVRDKQAEQWAVLAVELLERSRLRGLFRDAEVGKHLQTDHDLDFLRQREDFKGFLRAVEAMPPPGP